MTTTSAPTDHRCTRCGRTADETACRWSGDSRCAFDGGRPSHEALPTEEVDVHDPAGYAAWLRERAKANREIALLPREQWPYRPGVLQHWALRFDQGADLIERLEREKAEWSGIAATRNRNIALIAEDRDRLRDALREIAGYVGALDYNAEQMRALAIDVLRGCAVRAPDVGDGNGP